MTLKNVKLKVEAFDYLQLPFDVKEGVIGRCQVQVRCLTLCRRALPQSCANDGCSCLS